MVLVSVVKASSPHNSPVRFEGDAYVQEIPTSHLTRNFVPFLRTPYSEHQDERLYWRNQDYLFSTNQNGQDGQRRRLPTPKPTEITPNPGYWQFGRYYSESESTLDMPSQPHLQYSPTHPHRLPSPSNTPDGKESTKRWTFGGLFRRKDKVKTPSVPITIQFEPTSATLPSPGSESSTESEPRHNFLHRLSKKKKKGSGNGTKAVQGFLQVPTPRGSRQRQQTPEVQSWETTKCPPVLLSKNNNYSSSGSLSLSVEGSSSLSRGSRAAVKEAVKARAEARRESLLIDSSSGEDGEDEIEINGHGSHSSLSQRGHRRQKEFPPNRVTKSIPVSQIHRVSNSSPNLYSFDPNRRKEAGPKWEARIVYTQETLHEDSPVVVRLPKRPSPYQTDPNGNPQRIQTTESISEDKVITAGLRLPFNLSSSFPKTTEPIYANWRQLNQNESQPTGSHTPPPPLPKRDFYTSPDSGQNPSGFHRPLSRTFMNPSPQGRHNPSPTLTNGFRNGNFETKLYNPNGHHLSGHDYGSNLRESQFQETILTYESEPRRYLGSPSSIANNDNSFCTWEQPQEQRARLQLNPQNEPNTHEPVIMSKLGYPVRKLHEKMNPKGNTRHSQSPIQNPGASEFKKDSHHTRVGFSQSPNLLNQKKQEPSNGVRIRSADSSPLAVPRHVKIPPPPHRILHSNDSVSSLSSFSAETPSPNIFSKNNLSSALPKSKYPLRARKLKSPEFKIFALNQTPKEPESRSACERLNVKGYSPSPVTSSVSRATPLSEPSHSALPQNPRKSPGKNLEDALNELEDMYKSLRLSDEDLLDRAERRDLPTLHQELRGKDPVPYTANARFFRFSSPIATGSLESLATTSGSGSTDNSRRRVRAPPMRRSGVPDRVNDDMAKRKYDTKDTPRVTDPRDVVGQSGSYLAFSPAFSPPVSPCPGEQAYVRSLHEPDLIIDDVAVRNIRRANSIRVIEEPQPLFGVPLGPITNAPPSDYLHATPVEKYRPLFRHVKNPDVVKDDQAFRNLRKDLSSENNLSKDWTPRLFSPLRNSVTGSTDSVFSYNIQPEIAASGGNKNLRAVRSLSANISHMVNPPCTTSALRDDIGKWNSFTDLVPSRSSRSLTPARGSSYLEPSWVEQAELEEYGTHELPLDNSSNSNIKKKFKLLKPSPPVQPIPDPNAPRRPWTDIILESYRKESECDVGVTGEKATKDRAAATTPFSEEDNDVFVDAFPNTPSISPAEPAEIKTTTLLDTWEREWPTTTNLDSVNRLLLGQKDRRGSYVDPRSPSLIPPSEDTKRNSWSEMPKQFESFTSAYNAIAGAPKKIVFTPLPAPRRVKQISLEGFTPSKETSTSELELNDLIDALVKDAATCGSDTIPMPEEMPAEKSTAQQVRKKRPSRTSLSVESKWQAAIAELESSPSPSPERISRPFKSPAQKSEPEKILDSGPEPTMQSSIMPQDEFMEKRQDAIVPMTDSNIDPSNEISQGSISHQPSMSTSSSRSPTVEPDPQGREERDGRSSTQPRSILKKRAEASESLSEEVNDTSGRNNPSSPEKGPENMERNLPKTDRKSSPLPYPCTLCDIFIRDGTVKP